MDNSHAVSHGGMTPISRTPHETQTKNDNIDRTISYPIAEQAPVHGGIPPSLSQEARWGPLKRSDTKEMPGMSSDTRINPTAVHVTHGSGPHANKREPERWTLLPTEMGYEPKELPGKVSADEQHFTVGTFGNQSREGHMSRIGTSALGQILYAHGYRHTSHGLQRFDGAKPYEKQPDINAALRKIDKLSTAGLLKLRMRGGAGEKKKLRWGALPNPFISDEKKFEKAIKAWIAGVRKKYPETEWGDIETSLKMSYKLKSLDMRKWGVIPPSHVKSLTKNLKHVQAAQVSVSNATHGASSFSVLGSLEGLVWMELSIAEWSSEMFENFTPLNYLQMLFLNGASLPAPEKCLAKIAKCVPNVRGFEWRSTSNLTDISNVTDVTDADLGAINGFTCLTNLLLKGANVTNDSWRVIKNIKSLEVLSTSGASLNDDAAPYLAEMKNLKYLTVENSNVSEKIMEAIASLPKIIFLDISKTSISSKALSRLANCSLRELHALEMKAPCKIDEQALSGSRETLETLALDNTSMADELIAHLGEFEKLSELRLGGPAVTNASLRHLESLPLSELALYEPAISDEAAQSIECLTELQKCAIVNADISDTFLSVFYWMDDLQCLDLSGAKITDTGIEKLRVNLENSVISELHLNETLITETGLNLILGLDLEEISARGSKVKAFPEKLREFESVKVDLRGIEFDSSALQSLRSLKNVRFDDPDKPDDDQTAPTASEHVTDTSSHWQAMMGRLNPTVANQEALRRMSVDTYLSYPEEVKIKASVGIEMAAMLHGQIDAQMQEIVPDANCAVFYREAIGGIKRYLDLLMHYRQGLGKFNVKMDIQTPGAAIANVIDAFGAQVPGVGAMTSSVNQIAEAYGIRNFNRWGESVSMLLDANGDVDMFADTLARAMTLWYKDDLNDAEWVAANSKQTKYAMQVQAFMKGIGQNYTEHERHIMHLVARKLNWLFEEMGKQADEKEGSKTAKKGEVNLAEAIKASTEAERKKLEELEKRRGKQKQTGAQSGNVRIVLVDTDHLKIQPIMEALVKEFPRSRQDTLPPDSLSQELEKLIVWGKRDQMIPWSVVNERARQKLAKSGSSNLSDATIVLTEEPQSMEEQGESALQLTVARQNATIEEQNSIIDKQQKSIEILQDTVAELQKQMVAILKILPGKQ